MKQIKALMIGSLLVGNQASAQEALPIKDLDTLGIDSSIVFRKFFEQHGIQLSSSQLITVNYEEEGKELSFATLDKISITVPLDVALGVGNKGTGGWPDRPTTGE